MFFQSVVAVFAASSPWSQTDWSGGNGQSSWADATKFDSSSNVTTSVSGQLTMTQTSSWYDTLWGYRKKVTFDNSAQSENLTNFPVLIKLSSSNFNFSKAQSNGQDIRFTDSDGMTTLSYEIESWNSSSQEAYIWVKVPQINLSSNTDFIYMYYGNSGAADGQSANNVWDSNFKLVQHLDETSGTSTSDSTTNGNTGTKVAATEPNPTPGQINGAQSFDGSNDRITINDAASLRPGNGSWTVEVWANPANSNQTSPLIAKRLNSGTFEQWSLTICGDTGCSTAGQQLNALYNESSGVTDRRALSTSDIADGNWHHYVMVADQSADKVKLYRDGTEIVTSTTTNGSWPTIDNTDALRIGNNNGSLFYSGSVDEVRVSNTVRSSSWLSATYKTESDTFNTFASEETQYQTSGTLTSSIFDTEQSSLWGTLTFNTSNPSGANSTVKIRTSNNSSMTGATAFSSCSNITSGNDISSNSCVTDLDRYVQYQISLSSDGTVTSTFQDISLNFEAQPSSTSTSPAGPPQCNDKSPEAPKINIIQTFTRSVIVHFEPASDSGLTYNILYGTDKDFKYGASFTVVDTVNPQTTIAFLKPQTTYYFKAFSSKGCATSTMTETKTAKTVALPEQLDSKPELIPTPVSPKKSETSPSPTKQIIETEKSSDNFDLTIRVLDIHKKPVEGATVTLHSTPRETKTNKEGIAIFEDVEKGKHKLAVAYNEYSGEQDIDLDGNDKQKDLELTIQITNINPIWKKVGIGSSIALVFLLIVVVMLKRKISQMR